VSARRRNPVMGFCRACGGFGALPCGCREVAQEPVAAEPKPDNSPAACDRRGMLVSKVEALVIEYGLDEVAFALRVATEDRGG